IIVDERDGKEKQQNDRDIIDKCKERFGKLIGDMNELEKPFQYILTHHYHKDRKHEKAHKQNGNFHGYVLLHQKTASLIIVVCLIKRTHE
ncbi:hypothetical protein, partial [Streptomyces acidiscabies]|uniref:hypothetical protein n=1 Tax=Streptomyces acidiscabies TaxID=42234 RepID=UPI0038F67F9E